MSDFSLNINTNTHVDECYSADSLKVFLDESDVAVRVYKIDTDGANIGDPIVDKTFDSLALATAYYNMMINQIEQGDVIRNV